MKSRNLQRIKRHQRIRNQISGTAERPRLAIFRSNQGLYAQAIDDTARLTLVGMKSTGKSVAQAATLGVTFAKALQAKKISTVVFDRSGYLYHGRIKAFADAVREGGINF